MILQWPQSLLQFLLWFAVASVGGCASYALLRLAPKGVSDSAGIFAIFLIGICCLIQAPGILALGALLCLPSSVAAFFERATDSEGRPWNFHFGLSLLTYLLSILSTILACIVLSLLSDSLNRIVIDVTDNGVSAAGICAALLLTPASISLFRWIVHNSHVRPGVERHLKEGEVE